MLQKIKTLATNEFWQNFRDVRFLGFIVFGILVLLTTWSGVNIIQTNYRLQQEIAQIDQRNQLAQLENANLKLENEYFNTDTFLELTARQQFSKGAPGEKLVLVPKHVALEHVPKMEETSTEEAAKHPDNRPTYQKNFQTWMDFFLHRDT